MGWELFQILLLTLDLKGQPRSEEAGKEYRRGALTS